MIRKQTWILLAVFVVLLGGAFYLTKNPLPKADSTATPSPTELAKVLAGWQPGDITAVTVVEGQNPPYKIAKDNSGNWTLDGKEKVDPGKVEQLNTSLVAIQAQTTLEANYDKSLLGLTAPADLLTITNSKNQTTEFRIGKLTPTESGYYVQVGNNAPIVVSKGSIDDLITQVSKATLLNLTPTPEPSAVPNGNVTPAATNAQQTATP